MEFQSCHKVREDPFLSGWSHLLAGMTGIPPPPNPHRLTTTPQRSRCSRPSLTDQIYKHPVIIILNLHCRTQAAKLQLTHT